MSDLEQSASFGEWVKERRQALRLTQRALASQANCALATVKKIESDERRPSPELAGLLSDALELPPALRQTFIDCARGLRPVDSLPRTDAVTAESQPLSMPQALPNGTVTFLFTDIEGSTRLWETHPNAMRLALAQHDEILRSALRQHGGLPIKGTGDGLHAVFAEARSAAQAVIAAQQALAAHVWGDTGQLQVRMALHSGTAEQRDGDYFGPALNRAARLLAIAHGEQILLSQAAAGLIRHGLPFGAELVDLGQHWLKDLDQPERIYQLTGPGLRRQFPALTTPGTSLTSLPGPTTRFVARTEELAQVTDLFQRPEVRLVTLIGPGGRGKTRLGIEAARQLQEESSSEVLFVPLADVGDAQAVPAAIAQSLHLSLARPAAEQVPAYLRNRQMLLLLDNCEQLGPNLSWLSTLLSQAPQIKLLATSRSRLQLAEEWVFPVPALAPAQSQDLFQQAAQQVAPGFDLAGQEIAVREICQLLENLPLAIELAAGWTPFMSCAQIASHIQEDMDILETQLQNVPQRHRSLRAVFDHSWALLSPAEQAALMRLALFHGGWTAAEAQPVAGATLPLLRALVEKSLVRATGDGRFELHQLTRQYAADKLQQSGQEAAARRQHFDAYLDLAGKLSTQLQAAGAVSAFTRLDQELDNLRAALSWGVDTQQKEAVLQLRLHLFMYWFRRGHWQEGERWTMAVVNLAGDQDSALLCLALSQLCSLVAVQGRFVEAIPYQRRALAMAHRLGEPGPLAAGLLVQGQAVPDDEEAYAAYEQLFTLIEDDEPWVGFKASAYFLYGDRLRNRGHFAKAAEKYQKSLEICRQQGNRDLIAYSLGNLGRLALQEGRLQEAYELIADSVAISRAIGNRVGMGDWIFRLGQIHLYRDELDEAETCLREALDYYTEIGNQRGRPDVLVCLSLVALARDEIDQASQLLRAGIQMYRHIYNQMWQNSLISADQLVKDSVALYGDFTETILGGGLVFAAQGAFAPAATLLAAGESLQQRGYRPIPPLQSRVDEALEVIETQLSETDFTTAWERGYAITLAQLFDLVLTE